MNGPSPRAVPEGSAVADSYANQTRPRILRTILFTILPPLATFAVQSLFWATLSPFAWFLFYPTVLLSAWLGGSWAGAGSTVLSTVLVWWAFLPYEGSFRMADPKYVVSSLVYLSVGLVVSVFGGRIKRASRDAELAFVQSQRARDAAREAEERFRALVNASAQIVWATDANGAVVEDSPSWRAFTGQTYEQWKGFGFLDAFHPEDRERVAARWCDAVKTKTPVAMECRIRHASGGWRWTLGRAVPLLRQDGSVREWVGMNTDITARKHAEEALQESEAQFAGIVSIASEAIISVDDDQNIVVYNEGAEQIFGWKREEALGRRLEILIPRRFREMHRQHVRTFAGEPVKSRRMGECQTLFGLRKSGVEFPAEAAISKLKVRGKNLFSVVLRDTTERKRVEVEHDLFSQVTSLLASTIDYEETLGSVASLVVRDLADCCIIDFVDEGGQVRRPKVVHRDPSMAPVMDALQRVDLDSKRPHLASSVFEAKKPLLMTEVSADYLASIAQSDEHRDALQKLAPKSLIAVPLMAGGQLLGVLLFIRTSSDHPYQPNDLRVAEELGRRAALAVHHARLYRAAQRATNARDEILGIVAHDLRNHLTSILIQAALLQRGRPEGERRSRKPGDRIHKTALRMNRLIEDLLDVTCIEAGQLSIERALAPAEQVVLDIAETQKALASSAGLELVLDVARDLPVISVDRDRLLQVFENLVGNAIKFTPSGGRITVGATARVGEVLFWVENTGASIPAEHLPHLFDRFWQAKKREHRGAGLGLPIVKGIVEAHGGHVWVESTPGRGPTFYFTVPVASGVEQSKPATLH